MLIHLDTSVATDTIHLLNRLRSSHAVGPPLLASQHLVRALDFDTCKGVVDVQFLVFFHIGSSRSWISPSKEHPDAQWTTQQAQNFAILITKEKLPCTILERDNDKKYVASFDALFKSMDCDVKPITPISPNLQAHVERVIQTIKHEVLNGFCTVSNSHLDQILRVRQIWYYHRRCCGAYLV